MKRVAKNCKLLVYKASYFYEKIVNNSYVVFVFE